MVSIIFLETVIFLVLFLIHQSILDEFRPNLTSTAKDSPPDLHYRNIDRDYYNDNEQEWATNLQEKSLNMEDGKEDNNRTKEINYKIIYNNKTSNKIEQDVNELNLDGAVNNKMNYSYTGDGAINSTVVEAEEGVKASDNGTLKDGLKALNRTTEKVGFGLVNGSCVNETEFNVSNAKLIETVEKIDDSQTLVPSGTFIPPYAESSINFKNSKFLIDNSPSDREFTDEATTESNIITQLIKDVENGNSDNEIDNNDSTKDYKDKNKLKELPSQLESQSETNDLLSSDNDGEHVSSPFMSTSSVDFSSILLIAEKSVDGKKTSKQKSSTAHKAGVPDFTKSNGGYIEFLIEYLGLSHYLE